MIVRLLIILAMLTGIATSQNLSTLAQQPSQSNQTTKCQVAIYKGRDADRRAKILAKPDPVYSATERATYRGSEIVLRAILCGTGEVTDVVVKSGLTESINARAVAAAHEIKFVPGEHQGQPISTLVTLVYIVK